MSSERTYSLEWVALLVALLEPDAGGVVEWLAVVVVELRGEHGGGLHEHDVALRPLDAIGPVVPRRGRARLDILLLDEPEVVVQGNLLLDGVPMMSGIQTTPKSSSITRTAVALEPSASGRPYCPGNTASATKAATKA